MLESCPACAEPLDVTGFEPFTKVICPKCEHETRVKRQLGKYFLERRHAVGGMSVVYVAEDTTLDRKVAVKILNEKYSSDEMRVAAFESEARLTAAVNHPHVVRIFTVGRDYDRFYLVMELIEGQNFEIMMTERGALPEDEVLDIALQVAEGLRAANEAGVLHRDVKPGNILFTQDGRAKLVDFGLALITQGGSAQAEEVWATPYYVPPEALEKGEEDFRSDLYAFGATLYHALYGKPPFESTSNATKVLRRAKQTIPRLKKVAPWLNDYTCEAVDRMMAYQPKHRWNSYDEVISLLKKARIEAGGSDAHVIHGSARARRRGRKSPLLIGGISVTILAIAGGLFWAKHQRKTEEDQLPKIAEAKPTETQTNGERFGRKKRHAEAWAKAHSAVNSGRYFSAYEQLVDLSERNDQNESNQAFSRIVALLNLYLDGNDRRASKEASFLKQSVEALPEETPGREDLVKLVNALSQNLPIPTEDFSRSPESIADWTSLLAVGLKSWNQGRTEQANAIFSQVLGAEIHEDHPWFTIYQQKLAAYQHDASLLSKIAHLKHPTDLKETESAIIQVKDVLKQLKTGGRAEFTVESRLIYLARLQKGYQLRPYDQPGLNWEELLELVEKSARNHDFEKARGLLTNQIAAKHPEAQAAWNYLLEQATLFFEDLHQHKGWTVSGKNGDVLTVRQSNTNGVISTDQAIHHWHQLSPASLLESHVTLESSKAARRHQIAFAWIAGLTDQAETMADTLAGTDEAFAEKWREVIVGLSQ